MTFLHRRSSDPSVYKPDKLNLVPENDDVNVQRYKPSPYAGPGDEGAPLTLIKLKRERTFHRCEVSRLGDRTRKARDPQSSPFPCQCPETMPYLNNN